MVVDGTIERMSAINTCQNCKWFERNDDLLDEENTDGYCHRFPPVKNDVKPGDEGLLDYDFPEVDYDDWCGEFLMGKPVTWEPEAKAN